MKSSLLSFIPSASFLIIAFLGFLGVPPCVGGEALFADCSNQFVCGELTATFPFWGNQRPQSCGVPALELACENGNTTIEINGVKYLVLGIHESTQVLEVAREDYLNGICPPGGANSTFDPVLFDVVTGYENVTLIYGCVPAVVTAPTAFTCAINGVNYQTGFVQKGANGPGLCYSSVYVPVNGSALELTIASTIVLQEKLKEGFQVSWKFDSKACSECTGRVGGACGYDRSSNKTTCYCPNQSDRSGTCSSSSVAAPTHPAHSENIKLPAAAVAAIATVGVIVVVSIAIYIIKRGRLYSCKALLPKQYSVENRKMEAFMLNFRTLPNRYSYSDVKKMTNSFQSKLGQGGFGTVYKGDLADGRFVAVKVLKKMKADGEEFTNEVASISRTSHVNVVALLGFCYEGNKRALIYEYMPNGSLDRFICGELSLRTNSRLEWRTLHKVAIGIARGLEYLHRGCNTTMVHFDIKPHNVLLDEDFCPKISDFGLAKLCKRKESKVSMSEARGTVGYIAPELFHRHFGGVSYKSDVYSYGMILLEMVGDRKRTDVRPTEQSSESYFPDQYYYKLESGDLASEHPADITEEEEGIIRKLILVGLWCIRTNPFERPSMTEVIQMLEGSLESLQIPPKPSVSYARKSSYSQFSSKSFPAFSGSQPEEEDQEIASGPQS